MTSYLALVLDEALVGDADISPTAALAKEKKKKVSAFLVRSSPRGHYFTATASNRHSTRVEERARSRVATRYVR